MYEQWIRRGWQVGGSMAAVTMLAFGTVQSVSVLAHEESTTLERFAAAGLRTVEVHNDSGGAVRVIGTDTDEITVRSEISHGLSATRHHEAIDGEKLVLESSCPFVSTFCEVSYDIEMPAELAVMVRTPAGALVEDVDGDVSVEAEETVEVARLAGRLYASSVSGSITARDLESSHVEVDTTDASVVLDFADPPRAVRASSTDGDIEIVLPDDSGAYRVSSNTSSGQIATEISTDPAGDQAITASTTDGDVLIRYRA